MRGKAGALQERETAKEKASSQELIKYIQGKDQFEYNGRLMLESSGAKGQTDKVDDEKS